MSGMYNKGRFWRMPSVVLSGLLMLNMCPTSGFAEQMELAPEGVAANETSVKGMQNTDEEPLRVESVEAQDDNMVWTDWYATDRLPNDAGDYRLMNNVTLSSTWQVPVTYAVHLNLNGKTITLDNGGGDPEPVISISASELEASCDLTLYDDAENKGTITHASGQKGSGVRVGNRGKFVMKDGNISGNYADTDGGGVQILGGTFTMEDGVIENNRAWGSGGGVAIKGGTFTMTGGTIQNNGDEGVRFGGGVYVRNGTCNLGGGTITGNIARVGGGVAGDDANSESGSQTSYQIFMSGSPKVTNNQTEFDNGTPMGDNLCLMWKKSGNGIPITINGALGEDTEVGITIIRDNNPFSSDEGLATTFDYAGGIFTTGYNAQQNTDPWNYFTSESTGYDVHWTLDGAEAQLAVTRHVTVDTGIKGGTVTVDKNDVIEGETVAIQTTPNEGWELVSVTAKDADGKDVEVTDNKELVVPAFDVVVSATFKEKPAPPAPTPTPTPTPTPAPTNVDIHVTYTAHVQDTGDLPAASDGNVIGTTGESRRLEALSATVDTGGIEYRAHLQDKGWDGWVADGKQAGTTGESRRLEAIQMRLTGSATNDDHHVWYRVHSQDFGWLGWACDGEPAGTTGMSKRVEAYQVIVLRGDARPGDYDASKPAYRTQAIANAHLQDSGWTGNTGAGEIGTTSQSRRMEGLSLIVPNQPFAGGITYQVHEQGNGWTAEKSDGALAGTTGESRRIEAVRIYLTGELANHLSVWYRVHSETFGWSGWACDGTSAGTEGLSLRAEAVDIQILSKDASAPGSTANSFRTQ